MYVLVSTEVCLPGEGSEARTVRIRTAAVCKKQDITVLVAVLAKVDP